MYKKICFMKKSILCAALSVLLALQPTVGSLAVSVSDNSASTEEITVSENNTVTDADDPVEEQPSPDDEMQAGDDTEEPDALSDDDSLPEECKEEDLAVETAAEARSIKVTFKDVINDKLTPFLDTKTGKPILTDIRITCSENSAYISKAYSDEDNAVYAAKNPQNPEPWLRIMPVRRGYQVTKWKNLNNNTTYNAHTAKSSSKKGLYDEVDLSGSKKDITYQAVYNTTPYTFHINYHLDGGALPGMMEKTALPDYFQVTTDDIVLPELEKPGYQFMGWYTDSALKKRVTTIAKGTYIDSDEYGFVPDYHLYTKWQSAAPAKVKCKKASYIKSGTMKLTYKAVSGADGYEICFSPSKKFKKNINSFDNGKATSYTFTNLVKGTYYLKVRAYCFDSIGQKIYGAYSRVLSCKVKAGVKEYALKDAKVTMKKVSVSNGTLVVTASVSKRIKSADYSYYLVRINPQTKKYDGNTANIAAALPKLKSMKFSIPLTAFNKASLLEGCYALALKTDKGYTVISKSLVVSNPEKAASYTAAFPKTPTPSKKGLQGAGGTHALGVQHFFFNMDVMKMLSTSADKNATAYRYNGKTYYFNLKEYKDTISIANAQGLIVTGQLGMTWPDTAKKYLVTAGGRSAGHSYYSMNFAQSKSRDELEALFSCMAETFSTEKCHLDNWVLGNEVNMHRDWYYAGNVSKEKFMLNYTDTFRGLYYAVRSNSKNARVYICLDHNWAGTDSIWGAKPFMDTFHKSIRGYSKKIAWNLAYHIYPQDLGNAATWNDTLAPNKTTAAYVTPKNMEVLTKYVKKKFGKNTRIILSEQGFTSNGGTAVQAAGIAYTFYKAQFNDMIDAVIFHRYQDDVTETDGSNRPLNYGIVNASGAAKQDSYHVFKFMDTPAYAQYTDPCLKIIGISSWKEIAPGFNASKLTNLP